MVKGASNPNEARRYNVYMDLYNINCIYMRNPWVVAWWSAAFPGFGHLSLGQFSKGALLFVWEIVINTNAQINLAMVYSFTGRFAEAKACLNPRWLLLYIPVYLYAIWDSYRKTIAFNKHYLLAENEKAPIGLFRMNGFGVNLMDRRSPRSALVWSLLFPGLGHLYLHKIPIGFFLIVWCIVVSYYSRMVEACYHLLAGSPALGLAHLDPEWYCFYPSMLCFAAYDAYRKAIANNNQYGKEQACHLRESYQPRGFKLLDPEGSGGV